MPATQSSWFFPVAWCVVIVGAAIAGCQPQSGPPASPGAPDSTKAGEKTPSDTSNEAGLASLRIAAASDLKFALDDVIRTYRDEHPGAAIEATYGSSGSFFAQLTNRGPFDFFLSADVKYPQKLVEQKQAFPESLFTYATGRVVLWVRKSSSLDVETLGIQAAADPAVKKLAIADPRLAPYGRAAEAALKSLDVYDKVQGRLVLGENVAQTAQYVESGAADAGILSLSLALAPPMKDKGRYWLIPETAHPAIEQGGAILTWARNRELADSFREFLRTGTGRDVLKLHGFVVPEERR